MQCLDFSGAVRLIYRSLGVKGLNWSDRVRREVLQKVKEERNILQTIKRKKAICIGHILLETAFYDLELKDW